ncbi:pectinesterase-like [Silene latifolia]|uniref:pectinesterase-like n=1 Tax=Silene latifolia TaxID=37657 RepID=UPI003D78AFA8
MEFKLSQLSLILFHISLLFSLSTSFDIETICNITPYPSFCKLLLVNYPYSKTIQDYSRYCISESLSKANDFHSLVNKHLQASQPNSYALKDCQFLANLNVDFLSTTSQAIKSTKTLDKDQVHTLLSAIMTNLDTCFEGLQMSEPMSSSSVAQDLSPHLINDTMLYSVSLALFTHGWDSKNNLLPYNGLSNPNGLPLNLGPLLRGGGYSKNWKRVFYELGLCGVKVNEMVIVNSDGSGDFTTITEAVNSAPSNTEANSGYFGIYVVGGTYKEYVDIPSSKKYLLMVGDGINQTVITGDRSVGSNWTTFNSATFAVSATGFVGVDLTFRNTAGAIMGQAVAVRNGADLSAFYRCSFEGYQDTLLTHSMRQFYRECDIYGTVDFIFGNAAVVFQNCNILPRQPLKGQFNPITAQGREDPNQNTGTSIHHCNIRPTSDLASSNFTVKTYLGRPWKKYSRTVYMQSFMDSFIDPAGWHEWNVTLDTLYYAEFQNNGPGSDTSNRVTWPGYHVIGVAEASNFTVSNFIMGESWLPSTGVRYNGGLYYI